MVNLEMKQCDEKKSRIYIEYYTCTNYIFAIVSMVSYFCWGC